MSESPKALPPLPAGWYWATVGAVGDVQLGRQRSPEHHAGTHMRPYLRVANVFEDRIDTSDVMQMNFTPDEYERYKLLDGDILLNEGQSKELVGRPAIYRGEVPGACFQNTLVRFRCEEAILPEYALALFRSYLHSGRFQAIAKWTTSMAHLGAERFSDLEFPLPPAEEQCRIVAKLEALLARSRRAKEALDAIPALLEQLRQSVLAAAFRGDLTAEWREQHPEVEPASKLLERIRIDRRRRWEAAELERMTTKGKVPLGEGWKQKYDEPSGVAAHLELPELPQGWCWASVSQIVRAERPLCYGVVQPGQARAGGVPLVRVCDLEDEAVNASGLRTISPDIDEEFSRSRLEGGEVLVSIVGTIGRTAIASDDLRGANIARALARLAVVPEVPAGWVRTWIGSPFVQDMLNRDAREVARKTLNLGTLESAPVPLAPHAEMEAIVHSSEDAERALRGLLGEAHEKLALLSDLDVSLLAKAFRGELVEQDPNDEPASVLLERIRQERAATEKPSSRRTRTAAG